MNRRSLIALGLATALARFFPIGREEEEAREPWVAILGACGFREVRSRFELGDLVEFPPHGVLRITRIEPCDDGESVRATFSGDDRTIVAEIC
ncbi:MAG: hypothetical protein ABL998_00865 [Planctomycetota bacterium]